MSEVLRLVSHPVATRLGLALLHFVWQGAALGAIAALILLALRKAPATSRYAALLAVLAAMALCPVVTFLVTSPLPATAPSPVAATPGRADMAPPIPRSDVAGTVSARAAGSEVRPARTTGSSASASATRVRWLTRARAWALARLPWISLLWLAGVILLSLRFLVRGWSLRRLRGRLQPAAPPWPERLAELCRRLALSRPVKLMVSSAARVPMVIGWLRPVVVLPAGALTGLTPEQIGALLAHELAHLRRRDHWVALAQALIELLLFYHPAVWWVSRALRAEREHCCDDAAVAASGDLAGYLRALAWVDEHRSRTLQPALASSGSPLLTRIRRLGGYPSNESGRPWLAALLSLALAMSIPLAGAFPTAVADAEGHRPGLRDQWQPQTEHDPRLAQPVRTEILGRAAVPALELLSKETGVTLRVAPENLDTVGERKLTVIAQGCSLKSIMVQIPNALQECHWDVDLRGGEPVYLLHRNAGAELTMAELAQRHEPTAEELRRPDREARVALARRALRMTSGELAELTKTDPMLVAWVKDPERRGEMELFLSLPSELMEEFLAEGSLSVRYASLPPRFQAVCREIPQSSAELLRSRGIEAELADRYIRVLQHPENVILCYRDLDASTEGMMGTVLDITLSDGERPSVRTSGGKFREALPPRLPSDSPDVFARDRDLLVSTATLDTTAAETALADLAKRRGQEAEEAQQRRRAQEWREPQHPGLHKIATLPFTGPVEPIDVQRFVAKESGLSVVSDYFTSWQPRQVPEEARTAQPLWRLFCLLTEAVPDDGGYEDWSRAYAWEEVGDCLVFHYSAWFDRVPRECPESLLAAYREKLRKQGFFTLDDVAAWAAALQRRRPTHPVLRDMALLAIPSELADAGLPGSRSDLDAPALLLYAYLTAEQRRKAHSDAGLPYTEMTPAQQEVLREGGTPGGALWLPEEEITHAVYRVREFTDASGPIARQRVELQVALPSLQTGMTLLLPLPAAGDL
jgi:beta-lactamase regulating signal transducer with metallopeptidase domain